MATKGRLVVNEGVELPLAYGAIERAELAVKNPQEMALALLALLVETSTGLKPRLKRLLRCFTPSSCVAPNSNEIRDFVAILARLYDSPELPTWCVVLRDVLAAPPSWMRIQLPESLRALARLQVSPGEPAVIALDRVVRQRKEAGFIPTQCVSTIHKVKGRAFDHVIIPYCGRSSFPATALGRRLLYVSLSRARRTITISFPQHTLAPSLENGAHREELPISRGTARITDGAFGLPHGRTLAVHRRTWASACRTDLGRRGCAVR